MSASKLLVVFAINFGAAACTSGPGVAAHWKSSSNWGDGNCDTQYLWSMTVHVVVTDDQGAIADEQHSCDDGGFDIPLHDGATNVNIAINTIIQQDQTHVTAPVNYTIAGPIHAQYDLGTITIPSD